jgi:hypothetical protein
MGTTVIAIALKCQCLAGAGTQGHVTHVLMAVVTWVMADSTVQGIQVIKKCPAL